MKNEKILLASPHMGGGEMKYIQAAFDTNWIAPLGANVEGFEQDIRSYTGAAYSVATASGTAALHLALILSGVKRDDLVFCQSLTFSASANPIAYCGAKAVFIDSERDTWNMDPEALKKAIALYGTPKAVVLVHLYGTPAKAEEIEKICTDCGAALIEDAAEALGSRVGERACGTFGAVSALSFNGNKIITTSGGGMLLCKKEEDARLALKLATQARENAPWYQHELIGYNYRMSNICAGIGRGQMEVLPERIAKKREIFETYREAFRDLPVSWANEQPGCAANRWLSSMLIDRGCEVTPAKIIQTLAENNIDSRHMWKPMHLQPVFAGCPYVCLDEDVSSDLFARGVCLPSDTKMTAAQQHRIIEIIKELF